MKNQNENEMNFQEKVKKKHQNAVGLIVLSAFLNFCLYFLLFLILTPLVSGSILNLLRIMFLTHIGIIFIFTILFLVLPAYYLLTMLKKMTTDYSIYKKDIRKFNILMLLLFVGLVADIIFFTLNFNDLIINF